MNIREIILDVVDRRSDHLFLRDANTGREITYREFHRQASAAAAELQRLGVRKGDRIAVMMANSCELAIVYFACIYLGAVIVPINPSLSRSDVQFILSSCRPTLVLAGSGSSVLGDLHPRVLHVVTSGDSANDAADQLDLSNLSAAADFVPLASAHPDDLIVVMYTSGTSAKPKGLAHRIGRMFRNAGAFAGAQGIDETSRFYLTLSMAYMGGFYNLLVLPFLCGASVAVDHVFDARSSLHFWDKARQNEVNTLWLAPTVLAILLRMDRGRTGEEFCRSAIRRTFVGFAPLPLKVKDEFESRYGVHLIENYGLSETLFVTARSQEKLHGGGYVGERLPGIELRVTGDDGNPLPSGVEGEIQIKTPGLMAGYLDSEGRLQEIDPACWFATGDAARLEDDGALFITGRKKDLIIRGGVNISPAAIEEALIQVSGVADAAVVSIPHELYGEDVVAVLKLEPGVELETILDAVIAHAKASLAQHQQPARYIAIDEFPRTANGKVQKTRIRELVAQKLQVASVPATRAPAWQGSGLSR
ncbi:MAG TPA: class I adenylate-forming enzyme family protein [Candidatus Binatia bacterium]|nr:class I adenylate-forming enzyme family protein [Candidatus Binatia bacterium]